MSEQEKDGWCSCASDRHRFVYVRWDALGPDKPPCPLCDLLDARARMKELEEAISEAMVILDEDAQEHACPTLWMAESLHKIVERALRGEE
jgi:hypothetical protein